jgi:hypothetical protein
MILAGAILAGLSPSTDAQLLPRWFGPKTPEKAGSPQADAQRSAEVSVEIAWLADPVTFPYYFEAHATATQLEVRGYVPNKAVREHAIRIAQIYSSLPVVDSMKEHPSLLVRPSQMSPQQLQNSVMASLRVALPKQYQQLTAECGSDGKVYVVGAVNNYEDKLAISHALRRLHGCTSVQNLTSLPGETADGPPREKTPIVKTSNTVEKPVVAVDHKTRPWWPFSKASKTTEEPPALDPNKSDPKQPIILDVKQSDPPPGAILIPSVPEVKKPAPEAVKADAPTTRLATDLQKRIRAACPKVKSVEVEVLGKQELRISIEVADSEIKATAQRVFTLPELQKYRPELYFRSPSP